MKSIEQVQHEYKTCPKGHSKEHLFFQTENVFCEICKEHYDLGMKTYD